MRRKEREITDRAAIEDIIKRSQICRLAMCEDNRPYVIPLCFGYENNTLYLHTAPEGLKIDIIKKNPNVCVEFDIDLQLVKGEKACKCTMKYHSVIAFGKATIIEETEPKRKALDIIMKHYIDKDIFEYPEAALSMISIIKVEIEEITGKKSGY